MRMSSRARKFVVTATLVAIVVSIGGLVMRGGGVRPPATGNAANQPAPTTPAPTATPTPSPTTPQDPNAAATPAAAPTPPAAGALTARVPDGFEPVADPMPIGSIDPAVAPFKIEFTAKGAGVSRIVFADYWKTVDASRDARKARDAGDAASMPADDLRYVIGETRKLQGYDVPALALRVFAEGQPYRTQHHGGL